MRIQCLSSGHLFIPKHTRMSKDPQNSNFFLATEWYFGNCEYFISKRQSPIDYLQKKIRPVLYHRASSVQRRAYSEIWGKIYWAFANTCSIEVVIAGVNLCFLAFLLLFRLFLQKFTKLPAELVKFCVAVTHSSVCRNVRELVGEIEYAYAICDPSVKIMTS